MSVFDDLLAAAPPPYARDVRDGLLFLMRTLGEAPFADVGPEGFTDRALDLLAPGEAALPVLLKLSELSWWCGLPIAPAAHGRMAALTRATFGQALAAVHATAHAADPLALRRHMVFAGAFVNALHSPTRGAISYARALAALPETELVDVVHSGPMTPQLAAHAAEVFGAHAPKVRFHGVAAGDDGVAAQAIQAGPRTYHFWGEPAFSIHPSLMALFGPTVTFVCGDVAPAQFSDVYWCRHEAGRIARTWGERGAPPPFIENFSQAAAIPYTPVAPRRARERAELDLRPEQIVLATVGNRIGVEMDQPYVDGVGGVVLGDPRLVWMFVGPLQPYWITTLHGVLGDQFHHIAFDDDLPSLLAHVDIFANPFRAGGGNTGVMAIEAGAVVLTRGDLGDVPAVVPAAHHAADAESYLETLRALVADPTLRDAWRAEQAVLLAELLDPAAAERELARLSRLAFDRFRARLPVRLGPILGL